MSVCSHSEQFSCHYDIMVDSTIVHMISCWAVLLFVWSLAWQHYCHYDLLVGSTIVRIISCLAVVNIISCWVYYCQFDLMLGSTIVSMIPCWGVIFSVWSRAGSIVRMISCYTILLLERFYAVRCFCQYRNMISWWASCSVSTVWNLYLRSKWKYPIKRCVICCYHPFVSVCEAGQTCLSCTGIPNRSNCQQIANCTNDEVWIIIWQWVMHAVSMKNGINDILMEKGMNKLSITMSYEWYVNDDMV